MTGDSAAGQSDFGRMPDGREVRRVTLAGEGLSVSLLTLGAILQDVRIADVPHGLTVGSGDLDPYLGPLRSCGALIGPVVNRISGGQAVLNGQTYRFERNQDAEMTRHSGGAGTHRKLWELVEADDGACEMRLEMPDGEGGFPGNREARVRYALTGQGILEMRVRVHSDADTWVNFANHSYWSLDGGATYHGHVLQVEADRYCVSGKGDLVTGDVQDVGGTPFDFRQGQRLQPGEDARFDLNLCLSDERVAPRTVASLTGASGVRMEIETTETGLQVYDGAGFEGGDAAGHDGRRLGAYAGLALEAQAWPDAPNQPRFPSIKLEADDTYEQITRWRFSV